MNLRLASAPADTVLAPISRRAQPRLFGERLLGLVERLFAALDRALTRFLRPELNPLSQAGAIANSSLLVACATGILLLFWYRTTVHEAYASVATIDASVPAHFIRSLHRYSSDAALLFALVHAAREASAGRLGRVRWLAWTTGIATVGLLWLVGFLGYWLVWDTRGQAVALASSNFVDRLPILSDPLSRSFLADELLSSLLFFVVFFLHMLIPLAMGIGLWLHITRLSRPTFLTKRTMTLALLASMSALSLAAPADLAAPARMAVAPSGFALDGWFLWPVLVGKHLGSGTGEALALVLTVALLSLPWLLTRTRPRPAVVTPARCTACERCYADCPYDAIRMVPRSDGRPYPSVAMVDPSRCVGCGICAGSCDSAGIGLPWLDAVEERHALDRRITERLTTSPDVNVAFVCAEAKQRGGAGAKALSPELSGYELVSVPCAGWVHPLLAERGIRHGASSVVVVGCEPGCCSYREGQAWTEARFAGEREPALRTERVGARVQLIDLARHPSGSSKRSGASAEAAAPKPPSPRGLGAAVTAALVAVTLSGITWAGTRVAYSASAREPVLVVSLKATGAAKTACRPLTTEEKQRLPIHMQRKSVCERGRAEVRLRVSADGRTLLDRAYAPRGIWGDGNSVAIERVSLPPGDHTIGIEVGDSADRTELQYRSERTAHFANGRQTSVLFDQSKTFRWY